MALRTLFTVFLVLSFSRSGHALIGGQPANDWTIDKVLTVRSFPSIDEKIFPSVVLLAMGCTGTVVGPRHILTAAHCVVMDTTTRRLKFELMPGNMLLFDKRAKWTLRPNYMDSWSHQVNIVRTLVHPSYMYASLNDNYPENTGDVALIIVDRDIGTAQLDRKALEANLLPIAEIGFTELPNPRQEDLIKLGYGCESKTASGLLTTTTWNLKFAQFRGLPPVEEALRKAASLQKILFKTVFGNFYHISKAWAYDDTDAATNCPGDSGGALYHVTRDGTKVVGVNSRSRLEHKEDKTYRTWVDFHTRLDEKSALRVDLWLKRGLQYGQKEWFAGISYQPVVPRDQELVNDNYVVKTPIRDDLYVKSTLWLGYLDGIDGPCPLRFRNTATLKGSDGTRDDATVTVANKRGADRYARFFLSDADKARIGKFEAREISAMLEPVPNLPERGQAGICYLNFYALE